MVCIPSRHGVVWKMKIFIDTAKLEEIEQAFSYGILDGITTNPSLIKKVVDESKGKLSMDSYIKKILRAAHKTPVSLEVVGSSYNEMLSEGKNLFRKFNPVVGNVIVKVPVNPALNNKDDAFEGIKTIKSLSKLGIPVNCTLIFTPEQALMAAKAGAKYVSPFAGRIDDDIRKHAGIKIDKTDYFPAEGLTKKNILLEDNGIVSGVDLVSLCVEILGIHGFKTEVLAASIRNARQAREVALVGSHIATLPFYVINEIMFHHKTVEGMKSFMNDTVPEYAKLVKSK